jgi:hypothetical protein
MKTTLDIPEDLINAALAVSKSKTKRAVVLQALEDFTRRAQMAALAQELGDSTTFMSPEELASLRAQEKSSLW